MLYNNVAVDLVLCKIDIDVVLNAFVHTGDQDFLYLMMRVFMN